jgi:PKD repeat protein
MRSKIVLSLLLLLVINLTRESLAQSLIVDAGPDIVICSGTSVVIDAYVTGGIPPYQYLWAPATSLNNPYIYNPSASPSNTTIYHVTVTDFGLNTAVDSTTVIVQKNPYADAGNDATICEGQSYTLSGSANNYSNIAWTGGDGYFNNNNILNATYTPGLNDIVSGSVILSLTVIGFSPCGNAIANMTLYINQKPDANITYSPLGSVCAPVTIYFNGSTGNNFQYTWDFGDPASGVNNTSFLQNPSHNYDTSGIGIVNFNVTLTITDNNNCTNNSSQIISIKKHPNAKLLDPTNNFKCCNCGIFNINLIDTSIPSSNSNYEIMWGDGSPGYNQSIFPTSIPTHSYTKLGVFDLTFIVTNSIGCTDTIIKTVYNLTNPALSAISPGNTVGCAPLCIDFPITSYSNNDPSTYYIINYGDSVTDSLSHPPPDTISHCYDTTSCISQGMPPFFPPKEFVFFITAKNVCGQTPAAISAIKIAMKPFADFEINKQHIGNIGDQILFTNKSISGYNTMCDTNSIFYWDFGDGTKEITYSKTSPVHQYQNPGNYIIILGVTSIPPNNCDTSYHMDSVFIDSLLIPDFTFSSACFGDSTYFTDLTAGGGLNIISWDWDFGDGNSSTLQNPTHLYNVPGTYNVTLIVVDTNNDIHSVTKAISVNPLPTASFTSTPACLGDTTHFMNLSVPAGSVNTWSWDFGDGGTSTIQNPWHLYGASGQYTVYLIIADTNGCGDTVSKIIVVDSLPVAHFTADTVSLNNPTTFTDLSISQGSANNAWYWDFGDGATSTNQNPNHTYTASGIYTVSLTVINVNGCCDTYFRDILVYPLPVADFIYTPVCLGYPTYFTDLSIGFGTTIITWDWDFGDGTPHDNTQDPKHLYNTPGTYNVTLSVVDGHGCANSITKTVYVYPLPVASFTNVPACLGDTTYFYDGSTPSGAISTWSWDFGDNNFSTLQDPWHQYGAAGPYSVTLIIADTNGCYDTVSNIIIVDSLPLAQFIADTVCLGDPTSFIDLSISQGSANSNWYWDFGDGTTSVNQHPIHTYASSGIFKVYLTVTNINGCPSTFVRDVLVLPLPVSDFTYTLSCLGDTTTFTDLSVGYGTYIVSWFWDFGDGSSSTLQNPAHLYNTSGAYTVTLSVVDSHGCSNSITMIVDVYQLPIASFINSSACCGDTTYFNNASTPIGSIISWDWDFGDGNFSTLQNPWNKYGSSGTYSVTLIVTDTNGCGDTVSNTIVVDSSLIAQYTADTVCFGDITSFSDLSISLCGAISSWHWDFGDGYFSSIQDPYHKYENSGSFTATLIIADTNGCSDSVSNIILVNSLPDINIIGLDTMYCVYSDTVSLFGIPLGGIFTIDGDTTSIFDPAGIGIGTHQVIYTYTDTFSCTNHDTIIVIIDPCTSINDQNKNKHVNIFPNPSNGNIILEITGLSGETDIEVINTLGEIIFKKIIYIKSLDNYRKNLNLSEYPDGIYLIILRNHKSLSISKFLIKK